MMDVDNPEPISASSSFEKLDTSKLDLDALNKSMKNRCNTQAWELRIEMAKQDASLWHGLISDVVMSLTSALAATDAKSSVIMEQTITGAQAVVNSFNEQELREWQIGVRRGVEMNDWTGLITHRTYILDCRMVGSHVIATTVKLRKRKVPNVSLGVPIEYSAFDCFPFHSAIMLISRLSFHPGLEDGAFVSLF